MRRGRCLLLFQTMGCMGPCGMIMKAKHTLPDGDVLIRGDKHKHGNVLDGTQHLDDPFPKRLTAAEKKTIPKLSSTERKQWQKALDTIDKGWKAFVEVGLALRAIRESRLYREDYDSWEAFCRDVVGVSKTEANRQIIDAEVVTELVTPNGVTAEESTLPLPENRAQARALARVKDPEERLLIWQQLAARSGETPITAQTIEAATVPFTKRKAPLLPSSPPIDAEESPPSTDSVIVGLDILETLVIARKERDWSLVDTAIQHLEKDQA